MKLRLIDNNIKSIDNTEMDYISNITQWESLNALFLIGAL